jgi:hypothetical protein
MLELLMFFLCDFMLLVQNRVDKNCKPNYICNYVELSISALQSLIRLVFIQAPDFRAVGGRGTDINWENNDEARERGMFL